MGKKRRARHSKSDFKKIMLQKVTKMRQIKLDRINALKRGDVEAYNNTFRGKKEPDSNQNEIDNETQLDVAKEDDKDVSKQEDNYMIVSTTNEAETLLGIDDDDDVNLKIIKPRQKRRYFELDDSIKHLPVVAKVYMYLEKEYEHIKAINRASCKLSPLADILRRTSDATGVKEEVIVNILDRENLSDHVPPRARCERREDDEFMDQEEYEEKMGVQNGEKEKKSSGKVDKISKNKTPLKRSNKNINRRSTSKLPSSKSKSLPPRKKVKEYCSKDMPKKNIKRETTQNEEILPKLETKHIPLILDYKLNQDNDKQNVKKEAERVGEHDLNEETQQCNDLLEEHLVETNTTSILHNMETSYSLTEIKMELEDEVTASVNHLLKENEALHDNTEINEINLASY